MSRLRDLGRLVWKLRDPVRRGRTKAALKDAIAQPPRVGPGHYQSPMNSEQDIARGLNWPAEAPGVDLNESGQVALFGELLPLMDGFSARRYRPDNTWFYPAEAAVYQAVLRHFAPSRVVEVGSGFSTAVLLDTAEDHRLNLDVVCIDPDPGRLHTLLRADDQVTLITGVVQDVPLPVFTSLAAGDVLFIDSSHVAKVGSDVLWLLLHVLPRLKSGVLVHFHDVFWPFEYPADWLHLGRNWNEAYMVHAFLCDNAAWSVELFNSWFWQSHPELVPVALRESPSSSLWLRRR